MSFFPKFRGRVPEAYGEIQEDDYAYLHTLCTVWPQGPMAQAYLTNPTMVLVPLVAAEIREAIEASMYAQFEIGQDQIKFLRKLER